MRSQTVWAQNCKWAVLLHVSKLNEKQKPSPHRRPPLHQWLQDCFPLGGEGGGHTKRFADAKSKPSWELKSEWKSGLKTDG
jgi:hypothetical protein